MLKNPNHKNAPKDIIDALVLLYNQGERDQILTRYQKIVQQYPHSPEINSIFGTIYLQLNQIDKSIQFFRKATHLDPTNAHAHNDLGSAFLVQEKYDSARKAFCKAIKIDNCLSEAYYNLGKIEFLFKKYNNANSYFEKSYELNPENKDSIFQIAKISFEKGNYYKALKNFENHYNSDPECIDSLGYIVRILFKIGEYENAFRFLKGGLRLHSECEELINLYAQGLATSGKLKLSITVLREALKVNSSNVSALVNLIFLSSHDRKLDSSKLLYKLFDLNHCNYKTTVKCHANPNQKIICLLGFGRSGSLFLHSLMDGHPEIQTLPGYFFKGWFGANCWDKISSNGKFNWKEKLADSICNNFEPQFNALSKRNVIGQPNGISEWLARDMGFTQLGSGSSEALALDQSKFKKTFLALITPYTSVDSKTCFELIHKAFDLAFRRDVAINKNLDQTIFYHIHNPNNFEYTNFVYNYPNAKFLYIVRNPIQMLESWIAGYLKKINESNDTYQNKIWFHRIVERIISIFGYMHNPLHNLFETKGVRLEDLKENSRKTIPSIANWIGVGEHPSLFKSEFLNKQYSRPSASHNMITGFDTRSIDLASGRFFGRNDIQILETLLWPFMHLYGYTKISEEGFYQNLMKIRPSIDEPLEFEVEYFPKISDNYFNIKETNSFKLLHQNLLNAWETLAKKRSYPCLIKPLE